MAPESYSYLEVKRYRVFGDKGRLGLDPAIDCDKHRMVVSR